MRRGKGKVKMNRTNREWHFKAYRVRQRLSIIITVVEINAIQPSAELQEWRALPAQLTYCAWPRT